MSWISEVTSILASQATTNDLVVEALKSALAIDVSHGKRIATLEERLAALEKPPPPLPTVSEWIAANVPCFVDSLFRGSFYARHVGMKTSGDVPDDVFVSLRDYDEDRSGRNYRTYDTPADARAELADALIRLGKARPDTQGMPEPK